MQRYFLCLFLILSIGSRAGAESLLKKAKPILEPLKPVSVSYEGLVRCFPELTSPKFSGGVKLDALKTLMDEKFPTTNSLLRYRKVQFKKDSGEVQFLTLGLKSESPLAYELRLEKQDAKEGLKEIPLPQAQRINPKPKVVDQFLVDVNVQSDEIAYDDSKVNGLSLSYVKGLQGIHQLELRDKAQKKSVSCNQEADLGTICSCSKN